MTMKKFVPLMIIGAFLLNGCAYMQQWNPWAEEKPQEEVRESKVNPFLWQASLDKLGFMPIQSKNQDTGVIVTGWYNESPKAKEQFKLEVQILSKELRSDGVKVKGQSRKLVNGEWQTENMSLEMEQVIELSILKRARILYQQSFIQ